MKLMKYLSLFFILCTVTVVPVQAKDLIPVEVFSGGSDYEQVRISPSGKYLSVVTELKGQKNLYVLTLSDYKVINMVRFPEGAEVGNYSWVSDERIVLQKIYRKPWTDVPQYSGELFAIDADGGKGQYIAGYQAGGGQVVGRIKKQTPLQGTSYLLDALQGDEDHVLIYTIPWSGTKNPTTTVYKINVYTGHRRKVTSSPTGLGSFLTDRDGNVRVAVSSDNSIDLRMFVRDVDEKDWVEFELASEFSKLSPITFDRTGTKLYVSASNSGEPEGVYLLDLKTQKAEKVFKDELVSPTQMWMDNNTRDLYAVELHPDYPTYAFIDPEHFLAKRLKSLIGALGGQQVQIVSTTRDNSISIVRAYSDTNPGTYYLFNAKENNVAYLFKARNAIDPAMMATVKPVQFKSRDGLDIRGYLTIPNGKEAKNLPLVVMPHGGPHGPRDYWEYDPSAQMLASRGIAVLKVNFRGSGGYGDSFEKAGYRKWGREIQFDIIDGVKYTIDQGMVDKDNICIMGYSFGGYSALQSPILAPDLFKCAIGVVGVYDLPLLFDAGDIAGRRSGQRFLKRVLGEDEAELKSFSPSYNIDKLKAPVLIIHGGNDDRAPIEQAESVTAALKKADHPFEYVLLESEGHSFYDPENRAKHFNRVLSFLDKHLEL